MKHILLLLATITLAFSQMGGCATTGQQAGSDFWNSPAVQAELAFLEKIGTDALNAWIQSQLPNHPMATQSRRPSAAATAGKEEAIAKALAQAQLKCPHIPKDKVEAVVRAKFAAGK